MSGARDRADSAWVSRTFDERIRPVDVTWELRSRKPRLRTEQAIDVWRYFVDQCGGDERVALGEILVILFEQGMLG
jgi:hypothetical protein